MTYGSLVDRLTRGVRWVWQSDEYRAALPEDLDQRVMSLEATDRHHAKQGRSTARVRIDSPWGPLSVYLKRHYRLPWTSRLAALVNPEGRHTPATAEWAHLHKARALGIPVPDVVAAGERIGPWGDLQSYLMVAELIGCEALNEVLPTLSRALPPERFARLKRELIVEMAAITATLHNARLFHKDLYLCHFFLDGDPRVPNGRRLTLIDLHRLGRHRLVPARWRWKDLGQLLFSTFGVEGVDDRDRLRFWPITGDGRGFDVLVANAGRSSTRPNAIGGTIRTEIGPKRSRVQRTRAWACGSRSTSSESIPPRAGPRRTSPTCAVGSCPGVMTSCSSPANGPMASCRARSRPSGSRSPARHDGPGSGASRRTPRSRLRGRISTARSGSSTPGPPTS